ncbi:transmembrane protein 214 isoform X1 [Dromiciops gliroides]|uniref:transmembrane protein 214 isoform X1 n=1 Tax=Dromiciops gliroides TaxID=33562 RepID=UPI001CC495C6|nr:transmembrane protein 214 isoform X1 [Dromiciops gliroides]
MAATAAGGGRWEVVRKGRRPGGGGGGGGGGGSRRALGEANRARSIELVPAIQPSGTLFELGFQKVMKKHNKEQVPPPAPTEHKKTAKKTKKAAALTDQSAKQGRFRSLEEAMKALDVVALQKEMEKSQSMFPGNPSVWVKDLAGYLNYKLQAPQSEPTLSQHTHDYPYSLVGRELRGVIRGLLGKAASVLELFFDHCLYTMLQELDKTPGESLHGYRICIQAVLQDKPKIATMNLGKYLELLRSHQNRPAKCLTIMWALGQAGFVNLTEGLKVWLGIMLPVLGIKSLSPFSIAYLDRLLLMHPNLTKGFGMIGPKDFFPLLDFAYMPNNSLAPSLQEQLCQLYPRLKVLAFGAKPETTLHTYFPSFLSRATPNCPPEMKKELLRSLTECLALDALSFNVWRQLYTKHLAQSSLLLGHILETWDQTPKKMRKSLQEIIQSFKITNEELLRKGGSNTQDITACNTICKGLLQQARGRQVPWIQLLLVFLVFAAGFLFHDFRSHSSFQTSLSARVLQSSGFLPAGEEACAKLYYYGLQGYSWLEETLPVFGSHLMAVLEPSLQLAWTQTNTTVTFISTYCVSCLSWASENLPGIFQETQFTDSLLHLLLQLWELLLLFYQDFLLPLWHLLLTSLSQVQEYCQEACRGDVTWDCIKIQLSEFAHWIWLCLQDTTIALVDWALTMISQQ